MNQLTGHYLAYELTTHVRAKLLQVFPASFSKIICHHITIDFNPNQEIVDAFVRSSSRSIVKVVGTAEGDGVQCLAVSINGQTARADGSFYHITLSVEPPHKPVESNLLKDKVAKLDEHVVLEGSFQLLRK